MVTHRLGRKIPLPSTRELKHEFRMIVAAEAISKASSGVEIKVLIDELARRNGFSLAQAKALLERFGLVSEGHEPGVDQCARATGAINKMDRDISEDGKKP